MERMVENVKYGNLNMAMSVYTTRQDAHGQTASYSLSLWMTLLAMFLIWLNIVVWGAIGLVYSVLVWF
jgi:hypothetical protein